MTTTSAMPPPPTASELHAWILRQQILLEHERKEEREQNALLLSKCPPRVLARHGLALLGLFVASSRTGEGGKLLVELQYSTALHASPVLGPHTFRPGDVCALEEHESSKATSCTLSLRAVVYRVSETSIILALDERSASHEDHETDLPPLIRIVQLANEATYDRLVETLESLARVMGLPTQQDVPAPELELSAHAPRVVRSLLGLETPAWRKETPAWIPIQPHLNDTQRGAISFALRSEHLALIHGPPGTGKTTAVAELIVQLATLDPKARILVCGASNLAVDNLLERITSPAYKDALARADARVTRIGHPARVLPSLTSATLDVQSRQSSEGQLVRDVAAEIDELMQRLVPPRTGARAGNKSARNIPRVKGLERRKMWEQVRELRKEYRRRDRALSNTVLKNARIIMSTCHGAGARQLDDMQFDVCIIDEACQALEMSCWTPVLRLAPHGRVFLSGDHLQLPPTVMADAPRLPAGSGTLRPSASLEVTMFDRILDMYGEGCKAFLSVQYRMNREIMAFPNSQLYKGQLVAHESCASIRLTDLGVEGDDDDLFCAPLVLYDTTGAGMYEREDEAVLSTHSRVNENEVALVLRHMELLVEHGIAPESIAVLSPYSAQVHLLSQQIRSAYGARVEVGTVDGMQGREKEVVIVSLVRSNDEHQIGFLQDSRRLNVAMTRAKRQLVLVGDADTVGEGKKDASAPRKFLHAWTEHLHSQALVEMAT
jgi:putative DNA helicase